MAIPGLILFLCSFVLRGVLGQTSHTVTVGIEGSFYSPPTISAGLNDTVVFVFGGDVHTVTQSTFASPCVQLAGGFNSGFAGRGPNFSNPITTWTLRITNVSEPIWYFCQASMPTSHCESGMVGAINPPSIVMYNQFVAAAKAATGTPTPTFSYLPSGQGAFATSPPSTSSMPSVSSTIISTSFTSSSSSPASSISESTASPTSSDSAGASAVPVKTSAGANHGLIAGCAVAGALVVLIVLFLLFRRHRRRWARYQREQEEGYGRSTTDDKFVVPGSSAALHSAAPHSLTSHPSIALLDDHDSHSPEKTYDIQAPRRAVQSPPQHAQPPPPSRAAIRPLPRTPSQNQLYDGGVQGADAPTSPVQPPNIDINSLAMEVASLLLHTPPRPGHREGSPTRRTGRYDSNATDESAGTAPPYYRSTQ